MKTRALKVFIQSVTPRGWVVVGAFVFVFAAFVGGAWYGQARITELSLHITNLQGDLSAATALLQENITETETALSEALNQEKQNVTAIKEEFGSFQNEVGVISGTVNTLEKLSKTDPELLQKYSKVFFLNEHYVPQRLAAIEKRYLYTERNPESINAQTLLYMENLLAAAAADGVTLYVKSAYRSFGEQEYLKAAYSVVYGAGTANQFSADQGYSEHQLGTTVDFITTGLGGQLDGFEKTGAYQWMRSNAHRFGFTLSYPEGNAYYIFEPWHWRFVGVALATYLRESGQHFYDLDQREIDEYLVTIFE